MDSLLATLIQAGSRTHDRSLRFCTTHLTISLLRPHLCTETCSWQSERRCGHHPGTQETTRHPSSSSPLQEGLIISSPWCPGKGSELCRRGLELDIGSIPVPGRWGNWSRLPKGVVSALGVLDRHLDNASQAHPGTLQRASTFSQPQSAQAVGVDHHHRCLPSETFCSVLFYSIQLLSLISFRFLPSFTLIHLISIKCVCGGKEMVGNRRCWLGHGGQFTGRAKAKVPWSQQGGFQSSRKHRVSIHVHLYKLGVRGKLM